MSNRSNCHAFQWGSDIRSTQTPCHVAHISSEQCPKTAWVMMNLPPETPFHQTQNTRMSRLGDDSDVDIKGLSTTLLALCVMHAAKTHCSGPLCCISISRKVDLCPSGFIHYGAARARSISTRSLSLLSLPRSRQGQQQEDTGALQKASLRAALNLHVCGRFVQCSLPDHEFWFAATHRLRQRLPPTPSLTQGALS